MRRAAVMYGVAISAICGITALLFGSAPASGSNDKQPQEAASMNTGAYAVAGGGSDDPKLITGTVTEDEQIKLAGQKSLARRHARELTVYKLSMIKESARSLSPSPFLSVAPTPGELERQCRKYIAAAGQHDLNGNDELRLRLYLRNNMRGDLGKVIEAYQDAVSAAAGNDTSALARAYFSAYILGAHDAGEFSDVLAEVRRRLGSAESLTFLVNDAASILDDPYGAYEFANALVAYDGSDTTRKELSEGLLKAADGKLTQDEVHAALRLYSAVVAFGDSRCKERALYETIDAYAYRIRDYESATEACTRYIETLPGAPAATSILYRRALYKYGAGHFSASLEDVAMVARRADYSKYAPHVIVLKGMNYAALGQSDMALDAFSECVTQFPQNELCAKALLLKGQIYIFLGKQSAADECFSRIPDFHRASRYAIDAKRYLNRPSHAPNSPSVKGEKR